MRGARPPHRAGQPWATFLRNHANEIWACDFLPVTDLPVISDTDWYTLYFSKGIYQEGESAARFLGLNLDAAEDGRVLQVVEDSPRARALARAFQFDQRSLGRMVKTTEPGYVCEALSNVPFRDTGRLIDASARKSAIQQLVRLRSDVLSIGAYQHDWVVGWPGSGVIDAELRERIFATLFTALRGQYSHFGRLLLVIDIVLQELLLCTRIFSDFSLGILIDQYGYPDPEDPAVRALYRGEVTER